MYVTSENITRTIRVNETLSSAYVLENVTYSFPLADLVGEQINLGSETEGICASAKPTL